MNCSNSHFLANKLDDKERQQAMFPSACGRRVYGIHWDLCQPAKPADYSLRILSCHFAAKLSVIVERIKFRSKAWQQEDPAPSHVAKPRRLMEHNFGGALDNILEKDTPN